MACLSFRATFKRSLHMSMLTQALKHQPSMNVHQDHHLSLHRVVKNSDGNSIYGFQSCYPDK